ncbi:MAG: D-amino-acid transaminase [Gammaproteobacteria bacterium]|jgi:D-alanine transaminase|nr:D-amino-acid transaminase [Gammaproteobacteria bacterium]
MSHDETPYPIVYLNGEFISHEKAFISITDRGFLFGDGVYEVIPVFQGQLFRLEEHLHRLYQSLSAIRLSSTLSSTQWSTLLKDLVKQNGSGNQAVYVQITRGPTAVRKHLFPLHPKPTLLALSMPLQNHSVEALRKGASAIVLPDCRWTRCSIKAITLLPNVLLGQEAFDAGADEAILIREGHVTEGTISNVFIVKDNTIYTPPKSPYLLGGITRDLVIELAHSHGLTLKEEPISEARLYQADEIWLTSSGREIRPVISLDQKPVGSASAGPVWEKIISLYQDYKRRIMQETV